MMISLKFLAGTLLAIPLALTTTSISAQVEERSSQPSSTSNETGNADDLLAPSQEAVTPTNEAVNPASARSPISQQRRRIPSVRRRIFDPNYIGLGLNIGINGETALGDTTFAINSRIGLGEDFSFRPGAVIGNNASFLLPVTFDFPTSQNVFSEGPMIMPYLGGGLLLTTNDQSDDNVGGLATAGLDVPLSRDLTANAGLNVGFTNGETDWGLLLGVGYNIPSN